MKLSIIIPTLNEADYLTDTIQTAKENAFCDDGIEFIVVDSGSSDNTPQIAERLGAEVVPYQEMACGRARLLNTGALAATGDVYLFLDADTLLPQGYDVLIKRSLNDGSTMGGAFEFTLSGSDFGLRVVEFINRIRYRVRQRFYGDQGVFVRAEIFKRVEGFPDMGLLESAHLCKTLRYEGALKLLNRGAVTSSRRFIEGGIYTVLAADIKIWFLDLIGLDVQKYSSSYWNENKFRFKA